MSDGNKDEAQKTASPENPVQEGNEAQAAAPEGGAQPDTTSPKAETKAEEGNKEAAAAESAPKDEKNTQEDEQAAKQEESKAGEAKAAEEGAPAVNLEGVVDQNANADELN